MLRSKLPPVLPALLLVLTSCSACDPGATPSQNLTVCHIHPEPRFPVPAGHTGPGLVFATADFKSTGTVIIKVQVEDLAAVNGSEGDVTMWSGQGELPVGDATPPSGGTVIYASGGDESLPYWTTHFDRTYDQGTDNYWLFIDVNHRHEDGTRQHMYVRRAWTPSTTAIPDTPHDLD